MRVQFGKLVFDTVTPDEHREILGEELDRRTSSGRPSTELVRAEESGVTNAAGAIVLPVYVVPAGMEFRVHLVVVEADNVSPAAPFNGAGAWWKLRVSGRTVDEASLVAAAANGSQLPFVRTYGYMQGPVALNNEPFELELNAGPVNTLVRAFTQGTLIPHPGKPSEQ